MLVSKWYSLSAASLLELSAGLAYCFPLYARELKASIGYSQVQLEGVASAILSGGYFGWIPGLTYDALVQKHFKLAPRLIASLGIVLHCIGYLGIWTVAQHYWVLPYWAVLLFGLAASSGIVWLDAASVITSCHNLPAHQGLVAGLLKAFLGLSASLCTSIYIAMFKPYELNFLLFVAVAPIGVGLIAVPLLNYVPHVERSEISAAVMRPGRRLHVACGIFAVLIVYQGLMVLINTEIKVARNVSILQMTGALLLVALTAAVFPLGLDFRSKRADAKDGALDSERQQSFSDKAVDDLLPDDLRERLVANAAGSQCQDEQEEQFLQHALDTPHAMEGPSLGQCLLKLDYWLFSSSFFVIMGAGFTILNNLGQIVQSLGGRSPDLHVLCFTTMNCLGRLACGLLSELALHRFGVSKTVFPVFIATGMSLVCFAMAFVPYALLLPVVGLGGFFFGAHWPMLPALTAECFGTRHFCANQSVPGAATALGALLLSNQLAGRVYKAHLPPAEPVCYGRFCFRNTFIVIGVLATLQVGLAWIFWRRMLRHFRHRSSTPDSTG